LKAYDWSHAGRESLITKKNNAKERQMAKEAQIADLTERAVEKVEKITQVSVVIRTRDEEQRFSDLLKMLLAQTLLPSEIILVNNYSSDAKLSSLEGMIEKSVQLFERKKIKVRVVSFPDRDFSHPYSTNLGMFFAKNELVAITNAHAVPVSYSWLDDGVRHFKDPTVASVTGYSYPFEQNRALSKLSWYAYYFSERIVLKFSTMNCIIRKSVWRNYPFDESIPKIIPEAKAYGCEDYDWGKEVVTRGFKTVMDERFSIFHSHKSRFEEAKRNITSYVTQRTIQHVINGFDRPRKAFTRLEHNEELDGTRILEF
jgi:glycosyltransferase involved in cell wall biosynthesis